MIHTVRAEGFVVLCDGEKKFEATIFCRHDEVCEELAYYLEEGREITVTSLEVG